MDLPFVSDIIHLEKEHYIKIENQGEGIFLDKALEKAFKSCLIYHQGRRLIWKRFYFAKTTQVLTVTYTCSNCKELSIPCSYSLHQQNSSFVVVKPQIQQISHSVNCQTTFQKKDRIVQPQNVIGPIKIDEDFNDEREDEYLDSDVRNLLNPKQKEIIYKLLSTYPINKISDEMELR